MTSRKLIPAIAALLLAGAALADNMPKLPTALKLPQSGDSPGVVTFNHDMHVDTSKAAASCMACHPRLFSIMGRSATKRVKVVTHDAMKQGDSCGACHGKQAFNFDDCTMCHAM
jgi:c(7)-type cytochrome triheme protein